MKNMSQYQWEQNVNWANNGTYFKQALDIEQISTIITQDVLPRLNNVTNSNTEFINNVIPKIEKNEIAINEVNQKYDNVSTNLQSHIVAMQNENQLILKEINQRAFTNHIHLDYGLPSIAKPIEAQVIIPITEPIKKQSLLSNLSMPMVIIGTLAALFFLRKK